MRRLSRCAAAAVAVAVAGVSAAVAAGGAAAAAEGESGAAGACPGRGDGVVAEEEESSDESTSWAETGCWGMRGDRALLWIPRKRTPGVQEQGLR